jgi:transcription initiation factor TFIIIB Brf1 subunit/transcription initiation factor TFIIB
MSGEAAGDARCPSCGEAEVRHEFDLGCEICAACGHVLSERALTTSVQYDEDGAHGVFLHDGGTRGQHLAAARSGLALAPGSAPGVARAMFRDEQSTHLANINRSVDFAAQQLRLTKDAADDARALVVKASEGRWGEGDWTTLLVGACVYCAARQNTLPIAMRDVAEACQLDVFALGRVYNKLKRLHDISVPPVSVETFVARAAAAVPELTKESIARRNNVSMSKRHPDIEPSRDARLVRVGPETTKSAARSSRRRDGDIAFATTSSFEDGPRVFGGARDATDEKIRKESSYTASTQPRPMVSSAAEKEKEKETNDGVFVPSRKEKETFPLDAPLTAPKNAASRAKDLAPLVADAKALLRFARKRGLLVGRNPVPFVSAALGVAAEAYGVFLSHEKTASAARATHSAARRASHSLRSELVAFANTFEWGKHVSLKNLPKFAPSLVPHVAGALEANKANANAFEAAEAEYVTDTTTIVSAALARDAARRVEAMPVSFRAHEKTRLAREARLRRAKEETLAALDAAGEAFFSPRGSTLVETNGSRNAFSREAGEEEEGDKKKKKKKKATSEDVPLVPLDETVALEALPNAEAPSTSGTTAVAVKRPSRGGVRRRNARAPDPPSGVPTNPAAETPTEPRALALVSRSRDMGASRESNSIVVPEARGETRSDVFASDRRFDGVVSATELEDADFDWSDVALRRLLLEGVPDAFLEQEKALHAGCDESRDGDRLADRKRKRKRDANKSDSSKTLSSKTTDFDVASEAARRVRRRTRDASYGHDVLLGGSSLPGGVTWKTPSAAFVEQRDKEAMDAIPDAEIECLLRTEPERDFARALAAREAAERGTGTTEEEDAGRDGRDGDRRRGPVKAERGVDVDDVDDS